MGEGGATLVGRDSERELVAAVLRRSAEGHPGALLLAGEPGIGKTSLIADVTTGRAAAGQLVVWGRCLRFGAESSPYLPIAQLLTQWHRQADAAERERVLAGLEQLAAIAPSLGVATGTVEMTRILPLVTTALDRIAATTPLVVVVDDAQWADGTSLDLLAYLMAGFSTGQRVGLLVTYRDTDLPEGHRLHGWLADVARLPSVSRLRLERLGFSDAQELVARLAPDDQPGTRAIEVFERSGGNPLYTELLVRDPGDSTDTGAGLHEVLLGAWHRLDAGSRELLQLLALGGRPVALEVLERLVASRGGNPGSVARSLAEATSAGLARITPGGKAWFHHPLVAEVVGSTLTPGARKHIHRTYLEALETTDEAASAPYAAHLALHHEGAGHPDEAFVWSLRAADAAAAVRGYAEGSDHLLRACRLWDQVGEDARKAAGSRVDLWRRATQTAWSAGEYLLSVRLREEAIGLADAAEPASGVRLRLPLDHCRMYCGLSDGARTETTREVHELAVRHSPDSPEQCIALAQHALAEYWSREAGAQAHADQAVALARRIGSPEGLAWSLAVRSQTLDDPPAAVVGAREALTLAQEVGDPELLGNTAICLANQLLVLGRYAEAGEVLTSMFRRLVATSSVPDALWAQPEFAALVAFHLGRWDEARDLLRELLSHRLPAGASADVRGAAALLAFHTGDAASGRAHLDRARELRPEHGATPGELLSFVEAECRWLGGEPREAIVRVLELMPGDAAVDPDGAGELLVLAARAAADLAEVPGGREEAMGLLDEVERLRGTDTPWFAPASPEDLIHPAREQVFRAERARCHAEPEAVGRWRSAVTACRSAGLVWPEAQASYQLARALIAGRGSRAEAATALRHAAALATDLGATPLLADVGATAAQARVSLEEPRAAAVETVAGFLASLTPREREVLAELVTGRTYAEIASDLFISEKTVSVHVSNLLRKTGTSSRVELAELARRTG